MNILITGATGGIGENLLKSLVDSGQHKLFILSRSLCKESVGEMYETRVGNLLDGKSLFEACQEIDLIIHSAGLTHSVSSKRYFEVNYEGTENLLKACVRNGVKRFIFLSSRVASSSGGAYAESKLLAEEAVKKSIPDSVILSLAEVYGTSKGEAVTSLIAQVKNKSFVFVPGDGSYGLCPVHVIDVVKAVESVVDLNIKNKKYLIAGPASFSYEEFVDFLSKKFEKSVKKIFLPLFLLRIVALVFPQFLVRDQIPRLLVKKSSDINLAKKELGFNPVGIEEKI